MIGVTGHRPQKLGGFEAYPKLQAFAKQLFKRQPDKDEPVITGMALGWDQAVAAACRELGIPYIAAVPFVGQETMWPKAARDWYQVLLKDALKVHVVAPAYSPSAMQKRNEYIVDNSEFIISLFDGEQRGGTFNCIEYAKKKNKQLINVWEQWLKF